MYPISLGQLPAKQIFYSIFLLLLTQPSALFAQPSNEVTFRTDFEGGSLGPVFKVDENQWRCAVEGESDSGNRNRQASWYYFKIEGVKGRTITVELTDLLGEYNYKPGAHAITSETRPVVSYDQQDWRHLTDQEVRWNEEATELILTITPEQDQLWVAHQPPYTEKHLHQLLSDYQYHRSFQKKSLGKTPQSREIWQLTITNPDTPDAQKNQVWLMARQHSWEAGTSWVMEGAVRQLLDSAADSELLNYFVFQLIPMADPDGVARGGVRFNTYGHDLNRNWDLVIAEEMPEILVQKRALTQQAGQIDLFITIHNTESADYLLGPDLPVGTALWQALVDQTSFESDEGLRPMLRTTTEGQDGRMTVNQALWAEFQIPAYLIELKVERVEKLPGRRLVADWQKLGAGLIKSIDKVLPISEK